MGRRGNGPAPGAQALPGEQQPRPQVDGERRPAVRGDVDQREQDRRRDGGERAPRGSRSRNTPPRNSASSATAASTLSPAETSVVTSGGSGRDERRAPRATASSPTPRTATTPARAGAWSATSRPAGDDTSAPAARIRAYASASTGVVRGDATAARAAAPATRAAAIAAPPAADRRSPRSPAPAARPQPPPARSTLHRERDPGDDPRVERQVVGGDELHVQHVLPGVTSEGSASPGSSSR